MDPSVDRDMREIVEHALSFYDEDHSCIGAFKMYFSLIFIVPSLFLPVVFYNMFVSCCGCCCSRRGARWCGMVGSVPGFILAIPIAVVALFPALVLAIVLSPCTKLNKRVQFH
jgi:hypothetical protein